MSAPRVPDAIVAAVLEELLSRKGFRSWWNDIAEDDQEEICGTAAIAVGQVLTQVKVAP